jgi:hypothetical protein
MIPDSANGGKQIGKESGEEFFEPLLPGQDLGKRPAEKAAKKIYFFPSVPKNNASAECDPLATYKLVPSGRPSFFPLAKDRTFKL